MEIDNEELEQEEQRNHSAKKVRLFSAKEFRNKLSTSEKLPALQQFLECCNEQSYDYIFEYLQTGGSCLELFQLLETGSQLPPSLILEIANNVLLRIISNYPQFHTSAYESCRYFLNNHVALVNKLLSLASTTKERKVTLKLLTAIVTFSKKLAKEVLLHVNFNPVNLEVLTKQTGEKEGVRNAFIHFLISFLVEGEYPIISILLEKKGLVSSIMNGLQYDSADTICLVLITLKTHILEDPLVSKTVKMNVFSTPIVKDIVNLYNWKGPENFNHKKNIQAIVQVSEYDKSRVNEAVHSFLLVLCTSYKSGVIFRDRQLGLGKKTHNSLMYTVLDSLERPWEHSYAGELVTKICGACPDLAKTLWANLKTYLEPRAATRWLNAVKYAVMLVKELEPSSIDFCANELSVHQLAQVIQFLIAPTPILKVVIPEDLLFEKASVKHHVLLLLVEFLKSVQKYLSAAGKWVKSEDIRVLKNILNEHINRNFPNAQSVLRDWTKSDEDLGSYSVLDHLEVIFELLDLYESVCPQLLESLSSVDLQSFLQEIAELPDNSNATALQVRLIKIFINFEPSTFAPNTELFAFAFPPILELYHETKDISAKTTLNLLLKNTGIFEGCVEEIDFWINGIFDLNVIDNKLGGVIVEILRQVSKNMFKYLLEMPAFWENVEVQREQDNFKEILENLDGDLQNCGSFTIKHRGLSPLLFGALEYLQEADQSKNFKTYFNSVLIHLLHFQTTPSFVSAIVLNQKYKGLVAKHVLSYVQGWATDENPILLKTKIHLTQNFSASFLEGDIDEFLKNHQEELVQRPGQLQNCLNQALFYFTNISLEKLTDLHLQNCIKVNKFLIAKEEYTEVIKSIFGNPILIQRFSPLHQGHSTLFLVDIVKEFEMLELQKNIDGPLKPFRTKLITSLKKVLRKGGKKSTKCGRLLEVLEVFGLEHQQCLEILNCWAQLEINNLDSEFLPFYYNLLVYTFNRFLCQTDDFEPLGSNVITAVSHLLTYLNKNMEQFDSSACANAFKNYLECFPHNIKDVDSEIFKSVLNRSEFCKENSLLAGFLLKRRTEFLDIFVTNIPNAATKKGLMLSLLEAAIFIKANDEILKTAYEHFQPSIIKSLQKPKKAGQHFETYQHVVTVLISKFMLQDIYRGYVEKVQKFDASEPFHIHMLTSMFTKAIFQNEGDVPEKQLNNAILTLVHATNFLFKKKDRTEDDWEKLDKIIKLSSEFLEKIIENETCLKASFRTLCENDSFQLYCKFCLKFGLSGKVLLVKVLKLLVQFVNFEESEAQLLFEMIGSHSDFLELMLNEDCDCKVELLDLVLALCQRWPSLMQRNHIPVILAAYRATISSSDRIILMLLQMYEKLADQTNFYDFEPFLWGTAAATHYSVRQDIQKALWRQPKMGDILEILQEKWVLNTIANYPLDLGLTATKIKSSNLHVYDLAFFLPLFASLLAPENEVATYKFTKSGAFSLTIVALSSKDEKLRLAACHVLALYRFHLEARHDQKDKLLWLRYVQAISRSMAEFKDFKLNNFAAVFWAKMALLLTQPFKPLYMPLSHYLNAKVVPDLRGVPELYTFLHSSDVNYKEMRMFILEILSDGLRTDDDFSIALYAMAFKLMMELFSSCVADLDTKKTLLGVVERACRLNLGKKLLCSGYGLLPWLYGVCTNNNEAAILSLVIKIVTNIVKDIDNAKFVESGVVSLIITSIIDRGLLSTLCKNDLSNFLSIVMEVYNVNNQFLTKERLQTLIFITNSKKCEYLLKYGCKYFEMGTNTVENEDLIQSIVIRWINKCET